MKEINKSLLCVLALRPFNNIVILVLQILELFGAGTACVVSPVERINYLGEDLHIPTLEQTKPLYLEFKNTMAEIQYGKVDHPWARAID